MPNLYPHARLREITVVESGEPLCALPLELSPTQCLVRTGVAERVQTAQELLPPGFRFTVFEGHRSAPVHLLHIARRTAQVCAARPGIGPTELDQLVSQLVGPAEFSPYLSGSAVSVTLSTDTGERLDLGAFVDVSPERAVGPRRSEIPELSATVLAHRQLLGEALAAAGLINHPTAWWQWSWGDRYWALATGAEAALHAPIAITRALAA